MSSHYNRKTPMTKTEILRTAIEIIGKPHKDVDGVVYGWLLNDLECALIHAKKTHKAPLVSESMMVSAKNLYEIIKKVYDTQDFYCVDARTSKADNKRFAKENDLIPGVK